MKLNFEPRPSREELLTSPLHAIARDFPETLEEFRSHGVSLEESGDQTLTELDNCSVILDALETSTSWRPRRATA